ncbi:MFS transporter [Streptomyces sp. NPDC005925]|uniref:MFS transporter n=1 Tax=Streptomyces sp. NPDC005925 TaxID=3157172 RepID=UPI0033D68E01
MDTTAQPPVPWGRISSLVGGQAAVQLGSFALLIAMNWTAVELGGTRSVTLLTLAATVPRALMLIFGGAVADTLGPRFVLLRTTTARVALLAVGAVITATAESLWPLVTIALIEGVLLGLAGPASGVLLPMLARGDQLTRANSLYAMVLRVAPILGAPAGAFLIAEGELWVAMAAGAVTGLIWLGCLMHVTHGFARPKPEPGVSLLRRSGDGFRLLAGHPRLRWMFIAALSLDMAFSWPAEVALPLLVSERGWGVGTVGVVLAAFSAGALGSSALGAILAHRIPMYVRLVVTGAGLAAGILVMALMPTTLSLTLVAAAVGLLSGLNGPAIVTLYQQAAPEERMGAAMSTLSLAGIGTAPISIAVFSSLSLVLGVQTTWLLCGTIAFVSPLAAVLALRHPAQAEEPEATPAEPTGPVSEPIDPAGAAPEPRVPAAALATPTTAPPSAPSVSSAEVREPVAGSPVSVSKPPVPAA